MTRGLTTAYVLFLGLLAVTLPVCVALYLAHQGTIDEESERSLAITAEVLRRASATADQALEAHRRLGALGTNDPCSEANLSLLREMDLSSSYLQVMGHVADGRLMCSSLGHHGSGLELGPVDYVSTRGAAVRAAVNLGLGTDKPFVVLEMDGLATAVHPETLVDIFVDRPGVSLGLYGHSAGRMLSSRGEFNPRWLTRLGDQDRVRHFDGRHLLTLQRSQEHDLSAYVAVPVDSLRSRLRDLMLVMVPIGVLCGVALWFAILKLAHHRSSLPALLRSALKRRDFVLHYQPIVDLETRKTIGVEALLRWPGKARSVLGPEVFIPAAEACGLIGQFTAYVIARAAEDMPRILAANPDLYVSINLAATDLHTDAVIEPLARLVQSSGIQPGNLMIEATEHTFLDPTAAKRTVAQIRELGIRVAIDDFGTGYSSLSHLHHLQADFLKVDKVFVEAVGTDSVTNHVAMHILKMADSLQMQVIGEGVESELQARFLQSHGVRLAQGWLFCRALPIEQLLQRLHAERSPPTA